MNGNLGRLQDAEKYARQALQYLDFMTERERFLTRGSYFVMTGDYQQCVREYGELIARYPADVLAYNQRAICLARLRNMKGAADELRKALEVVPQSVIHRTNYALLLDLRRRFRGGGAGNSGASGAERQESVPAWRWRNSGRGTSRKPPLRTASSKQPVRGAVHLPRPGSATWRRIKVDSRRRSGFSRRALRQTCVRRIQMPQP